MLVLGGVFYLAWGGLHWCFEASEIKYLNLLVAPWLAVPFFLKRWSLVWLHIVGDSSNVLIKISRIRKVKYEKFHLIFYDWVTDPYGTRTPFSYASGWWEIGCFKLSAMLTLLQIWWTPPILVVNKSPGPFGDTQLPDLYQQILLCHQHVL